MVQGHERLGDNLLLGLYRNGLIGLLLLGWLVVHIAPWRFVENRLSVARMQLFSLLVFLGA